LQWRVAGEPHYFLVSTEIISLGTNKALLTTSKDINEFKKVSLSLLVSSGDNASIDKLMENPTLHAQNFINDVTPVLDKYNFIFRWALFSPDAPGAPALLSAFFIVFSK